MNFTHLHVHTEYSLLDGSNKIKEYVARVKELGMDSAAITDHGVMYGVIDFYKECLAQEIRPIIGCEVYVAPGSRFDREISRGDDRYFHLILLAENNQGYANLMKIVSKGFVDGYYYKPRVDKEVLRTYHEGIICTSACLAGEVQRFLARGLYEEAKEAALSYRDIFGEGNFFLELQDHGIPEQKQVNAQLLRMSRELGIGLVATNDCHYTCAEDAAPHDILLCLQTGKKLQDEDRMRYEGGQYYVKSPEEMAALFPYAPEALENTYRIAQRCSVTIEFGHYKLPRFDVPGGISAWEYLNELCQKGLSELYDPVTEELRERLGYELQVIRQMGFVDYFLIVWDYIRYARSVGISVGPGRGSAAGSLVSYSLGITKLDPIRYNLLFERFLNPSRVSMPDIDVDFDFERRQEVIDYVVRRYGKDCVAQIVTFGTLAARGVIRDVGRVMDLPYSLCDTISKKIPMELGITIDKALQQSQELRTMYETDEKIHELIDMSKRLEGLPRHTSMHAAGVVICQKEVDEFVPLSRSSDGSIVTQFTMTAIESLGLLKMDFLGLRTLTVIQNAVRMASDREGREIDIDRIDYSDPKVYEYISTGKCDGIFQLESAGMKSFMKELRPGSLEDLIAGISLYRPGPMDFIPQYIRGKNHPETITYDTPLLEPILQPTYGCIVYQEQVMQIVQSLGGFNLGQSDNVRRAMSKKKASVMAEQRKNFVYGNENEGVPGCIANGIDEQTANKIYDEMTDFAKYAFNKSHAAAYAVVAFQTAWLKYYYPLEFMAAIMTSVMGASDKLAAYLMYIRQAGLKLSPPDVNAGGVDFSVEDGSIYYALTAIKGIGAGLAEKIVEEREEHGAYRSFKDFVERTADMNLNKDALENLVKAGALDSLGMTRKEMIFVGPDIVAAVMAERKKSMSGQMSLFDLVGEEEKAKIDVPVPKDIGEYPKETLLTMEKEVLGIYLSGHPLEAYTGLWKKIIHGHASDLELRENEETGESYVEAEDGQQTELGGIVVSVKVKYTKKGDAMAFVTLEDLTGQAEVIVFPKVYQRCRDKLYEDNKLVISGRISEEEGKDAKLIADNMDEMDSFPRTLWLQFADDANHEKLMPEIRPLLEGSDGSDSVRTYVAETKIASEIDGISGVNADQTLIGRLTDILGEDNVRITFQPIHRRKQFWN